MRRGIAAAVAVLATGCFSVPPYEPETRVSYTESGTGGTGGTVAGTGFALRFAGGDGFHFPDALMIGDTDVMGHGPADDCSEENEIGFRLAPTPRIAADGGAMPVTNRLTPVLRGPAVAQVKLEWTTTFGCSSARIPGGTATFTVFPDGRIVRYDTLFDPNADEISPGLCTCQGSKEQLFKISTFWTLARTSFLKLYLPDSPPLSLSGLALGQVTGNYATACVDGADSAYQVAFAWPEIRDDEIRTYDTMIGFSRDLFVDSNLRKLDLNNSSAIFIGHAGCGAMATTMREGEYLVPSALSINGVAASFSARDGIYGGDGSTGKDSSGNDSPPGVVFASEQAVLTGTVSSSFAVWLRFPHSVGALRATSTSGLKGPWYLPQRVDDRSWIVWFPGSISAGDMFTIEPI